MIRKPYVAGVFYPKNKEELVELLKNFEKQIDKNELNEKLENIEEIKAIISPHAGYIFSGLVSSYVYKAVYIISSKNKKELKNIYLWGPTHYFYFIDYIQPLSLKTWETPLGLVNIKEVPLIKKADEPFIPEHSLEVQLPFLQYYFKEFSITSLLFGELNDLEPLLKTKGLFDLIVVSSDLSHYYSYEKAKKIDLKTLELIENLDIKGFAKYGEACGKEVIIALMMIAKKENWKVKVLKYLNSGDIFGDKEKVVGYGGVIFYK